VVTAEPSIQTQAATRNNISAVIVAGHSFNGFSHRRKRLLRVLLLALESAHWLAVDCLVLSSAELLG
jgi:hypothetical protein